MHVPSRQGSTAALGLYINSGSIYESPENAGASHMLEYLAFRTTQHRFLHRHAERTTVFVRCSGYGRSSGAQGVGVPQIDQANLIFAR